MRRLALVTAPGIAADFVNKIKDELTAELKAELADGSDWEIDIFTDPLTGKTEFSEKIYTRIDEYLRENSLDYLISLTDLPLFYEDKPVVIDIDTTKGISMISLPAFGWRPMKQKIKNAIINTVSIIDKTADNEYHIKQEVHALNNLFTFSKLKSSRGYIENSKEKHLLFYMHSKIGGMARLISGMTFSNNPYNLMQSLSGVTAIAFATGSFGIIFSTMWNLSYLFPTWRLVAVSVLSIIGMLIWIIFSHDLWENQKEGESRRIVSLYNSTTLLTLFISLLLYYLLLYLLFLAGSAVLLPPDFVAETLQTDNIGIQFYLELAWFAASITTVAGAIGAGLQDKETIQKSTYGYRQRLRYEESQHEN